MYDIVCSPPGASSNFLASIIAVKNNQQDLVIYTPSNNEYRIWVKPYNNNKYYKPDPITLWTYQTGWINNKFPSLYNITPSVSRMHPMDNYIPVSELKFVVNNTKNVYNIKVDSRCEEFIKLLAVVKNDINKNFFGTTNYIITLKSLLYSHPEWLIDFSTYCRYFKAYNIYGLPMNIAPMKYFQEFYLKTKTFDLDHYKQYIRNYIKGYQYTNDTVIPPQLKSKIVNINYYDLFFDNKETCTIFDNHIEEIQVYHEKNLDLINDFKSFYDL
jgi:hypothetical protein